MGEVVGFQLRVQRCRAGLLARRRGFDSGTFGGANRGWRRRIREERRGGFAPQNRRDLDAKMGFVG
jgi:hypothetical protein